MSVRILLVIVSLLISSQVAAQMATRTGMVTEIQAESSNRIGYQNIMYVNQLESWSATNCRAPYGYFNAKDNPQFVAMILASRVSKLPLKVYIDDTYPKISNFCQIINMSL